MPSEAAVLETRGPSIKELQQPRGLLPQPHCQPRCWVALESICYDILGAECYYPPYKITVT